MDGPLNQIWSTHNLSDGGMLARRSRGKKIEHDGVARLKDAADTIDENDTCNNQTCSILPNIVEHLNH